MSDKEKKKEGEKGNEGEGIAPPKIEPMPDGIIEIEEVSLEELMGETAEPAPPQEHIDFSAESLASIFPQAPSPAKEEGTVVFNGKGNSFASPPYQAESPSEPTVIISPEQILPQAEDAAAAKPSKPEPRKAPGSIEDTVVFTEESGAVSEPPKPGEKRAEPTVKIDDAAERPPQAPPAGEVRTGRKAFEDIPNTGTGQGMAAAESGAKKDTPARVIQEPTIILAPPAAPAAAQENTIKEYEGDRQPSIIMMADGAKDMIRAISGENAGAVAQDAQYIPQSPSSEAPWAGRKFADKSFEMIKLLGKGGLASGGVYLAKVLKETGKNRKGDLVAIKFVSVPANPDDETVDRMRRECNALEELDHPNIVGYRGNGRIFEKHPKTGDMQDLFYIAMEYVQHDELSTRVRVEGKLSVKEAMEIALKVGSGLGYAHEKGIAHRDIKLDNLLIDPRGNVKLADMGLAIFTEASKEARKKNVKDTVTGMMMGTPQNMAPEQPAGKYDDPTKIDSCQLCGLVMKLVSGEYPYEIPPGETAHTAVFSGPMRTYMEKKDPPRLSKRRGSNEAMMMYVDPIIDGVLATGMSTEPTQRYDMKELMFMLKGILESANLTREERAAEAKKAEELLQECKKTSVGDNTATAEERIRKIAHSLFYCEGETREQLMEAAKPAIDVAEPYAGDETRAIIGSIRKDKIGRADTPPEAVFKGDLYLLADVQFKGELYYLAKDNVDAVSAAVRNLESMTGYKEEAEKGIVMPAYNSKSVAIEVSAIKGALGLIGGRLKELALQREGTTVNDAEMGELTAKFTDASAKLERMEDYAYARIFAHAVTCIVTNEYSVAFDRLDRLKGKVNEGKKFYSSARTQYTLSEEAVQENLKIAALEMQLSMLEENSKKEGVELGKSDEAVTAMKGLVGLYTKYKDLNPGYHFKAEHYIKMLGNNSGGQAGNAKTGQEPDSPAPAPAPSS